MKNSFCLYSFLILICCSPNDEITSEFDEKLLIAGYEETANKVKSIVILPGAGCTSCISEIESYFIDHIYDHPETLLILTAFSSKKTMDISFQRELTNSEIVLIDKDDLFNSGQFLSLYPMFIYLENGKIIRYEYAKPENPNAFSNYLNSLN
jgi:hypothetical protein